MLIRSLLGLAALLAATSCVPSHVSGPDHGRAVAAIDPAEASLLRRLALDMPDADAGPVAATPAALRIARPVAAPPFIAISQNGDDATRAVECLTAAVYYEARSEPADGQRAVAQVVLNRVRDRAFPASVCGVVYQRSARGCQFSFACDGSTTHPVDPAAWRRARAVAEAGFGGAVYTPVGAATYYHTAAVAPWWAPSLARIGRIGAHIFYGWRRAMADALTFRRSYAGIEPGAALQVASALPDDAPAAAGVTIHRGNASPDPTVAAEPGDEDHAVRGVVLIAGVRIHRRSRTAIAIDAAAAPEDDTHMAGADPI